MTREELMAHIREKHAAGYNCCQIVADYFADAVELDQDTAYKIAEGFAAGMGRMEGVCGAVVGAVMITGLKNSRGTDFSKNPTTGQTLQLVQQIITKFKERNEMLICKELRERAGMSAPCDDKIADAIEVASEVLGL